MILVFIFRKVNLKKQLLNLMERNEFNEELWDNVINIIKLRLHPRSHEE